MASGTGVGEKRKKQKTQGKQGETEHTVLCYLRSPLLWVLPIKEYTEEP